LVGLGLILFIAASAGAIQQYRLRSLLVMKDASIAEVEKLRVSKSEQEKKAQTRQAIQTVLNRPIAWTPLLNKVARRMPSSVRFLEVAGTLDQKRALTLKGQAQTLPRIFELKANLELIPDCEKIVLLNLAQIDDPKRPDRITFEMECRIR